MERCSCECVWLQQDDVAALMINMWTAIKLRKINSCGETIDVVKLSTITLFESPDTKHSSQDACYLNRKTPRYIIKIEVYFQYISEIQNLFEL